MVRGARISPKVGREANLGGDPFLIKRLKGVYVSMMPR